MPNKSMVIIEMPENCEVCPFNYDYIECTASEEYLKLKYEDFARRNDKCPLRPADAIPVDWIEDYIAYRSSLPINRSYVQDMLKDWEKVNAGD